MKGKSFFFSLPVQNVTQRNRHQSVRIKILVLTLSIKHETDIDQGGAHSGGCLGSLGWAQSAFNTALLRIISWGPYAELTAWQCYLQLVLRLIRTIKSGECIDTCRRKWTELFWRRAYMGK